MFSPLFNKLAIKQLADLMVDVYQWDVKELSSLKDFSSSLHLYRNLCRQFIARNDVTSWTWLLEWRWNTTNNMLIETVTCLLWLGDDQCLSDLADKILSIYPDNEPNSVILRILQSVEIEKLVGSIPRASDFLCRLSELRTCAVTAILAALSWRMPNASLPGHPNVQAFLRSSTEKMTYANFISREQAEIFAAEMSSITDNGNSVQVDVTGEQFATRCDIVKINRQKNEGQFSKEALLVSELEQISSSLKRWKQSGLVEDDDVTILDNPAKKAKMDFPVIDLSE